MKKMLKNIGVLVFGLLLLVGNMPIIYASSSNRATISYVSEDAVSLGEEVEVKLTVSDILEGEIVGIGIKLQYDKDYLELIDAIGMEEPFKLNISKDNSTIAGLSFSLEGFSEDTVIYTFKFKALKEGNVTLGFLDTELTDDKTDIINTTEVNKTITIKEKDEQVVKEEIKIDIKEPINKIDTQTIRKSDNEVKRTIRVKRFKEVVSKIFEQNDKGFQKVLKKLWEKIF